MSKNLQTVEELETELQENLGWRKKEIISFKLLIEQNGANEEVLLRLGIALLSAHFEGFIKFASNCYIKFVSSQKIEVKKLKDNFGAIMLLGEFKKCQTTEKNSVQANLLNKYYSLLDSPFVSKKDVISTHSNPGTNELKEILFSLGLSTEIFNLKANYIDCDLLSNRHRIVHGERHTIKKDEFDQTFAVITKMLEEYEEFIVKAADHKEYLRTSA